jgi:hypothetical protein
MTMPPGCWLMCRGRPAISRVSSRHPGELVGDTCRIPPVGDACEALELRERQAERAADVADRTAAAVARKRGDECGVLTAVAFGDADDQLLADLAREVEVDVGHGDHLVVDEPSE